MKKKTNITLVEEPTGGNWKIQLSDAQMANVRRFQRVTGVNDAFMRKSLTEELNGIDVGYSYRRYVKFVVMDNEQTDSDLHQALVEENDEISSLAAEHAREAN